jgi:hypothetical protein
MRARSEVVGLGGNLTNIEAEHDPRVINIEVLGYK